MSEEGESRRGNEGGGSLPPDGRKCYKCGESGHFVRDCAEYWRVRAQGRTFVPLRLRTTQTRTGSTNTSGEYMNSRRSRSTDSGNERSMENTDSLIRDKFLQVAEERRERVECEREIERRRLEEEVKRAKELKRALREEQRLQREEERDARLMRIIRGEMRKEREEEIERYELRGGRSSKTTSRADANNEEKESLRRMIALKTLGMEETEDEELLALPRQAAKLDLLEKRKRGPDIAVGDSPPMTTPEKRSNTKLSEEAKARIQSIKGEQAKEVATSSTPSKIDLSLKHIMASCGPGGRETFEKERQDFYDALNIEELKEACRREKVAYGKRELAIKRLITRRSVVAYDPSNIPLPVTPRTTTRTSKGVAIKEEARPVSSESDDSFSDDDSE
ncbi:hypothetical protein CBR_g45793 [Chara braunii]|uniref:CCHC-type domain-containing protein n=1 Tax=Chara braunii TaxID=69332 RepID=A0A388LZ84_CHABU|nr:hypothetical protein CBR_g45793 [Chara braunii]|eukprot:GBG87640.1 hypothetical protein CBR_g45793 [Chara braunii]